MIKIYDSSFTVGDINPNFINRIFIDRIELYSSWLLCETITRGESWGTETIYNIWLFTIDKTVTYQITMNIQYFSVLWEIRNVISNIYTTC